MNDKKKNMNVMGSYDFQTKQYKEMEILYYLNG